MALIYKEKWKPKDVKNSRREIPGVKGWLRVNGGGKKNQATIVRNPFARGYCVECRTDFPPEWRTDFVHNFKPHPDYRFVYDCVRFWVGFSVWTAEDFKTTGDRLSIFNLHGKGRGTKNSNPPEHCGLNWPHAKTTLAIEIGRLGEFTLKVLNPLTWKKTVIKTGVKVEPGKRYDIVLNGRVGNTFNSFAFLWINGKGVADYNGPIGDGICTPRQYLKWGIYRAKKGQSVSNTLYFGEIRKGNYGSSYSEVYTGENT